MTVLYILDSNERIKAILENDIYSLSHVSKIADGTEDTGKLNKIWMETLSFAIPSINSNAPLIDVGVKIVNIDETGKMKMFNVYDVGDAVRGNIHLKTIVAYNACIWDLYKTYTEPYEWTYADPQTVFTNIFNNTGWTVTEIFDDGAVREAPFSIARGTKQAAMDAALKLFEAEAEAWVELVDGQILKKVKIVDNLGRNKRHRFEYRKNIKGLSRQKIETDFFTRLYVFGGTPAGETTPISIAPANNGMEYITDYDAQDKYVPGNRTIDGVITNEKITNPVALLSWAEKQMDYYNHPKYQYTVDVALFKEKPELGDTAVVVDFEMDPVLTVEARVVETNYGETNSITLGEFTTIDASQLDLSKIQDMINRVEGTVGSLSGEIGGIKENVKDVQDGLKELDGVKEEVEDLLAYLTDEQKQQLADAIKDIEDAKERIEAAEEKMKNSPNVSMGELTPANPKEGDIHYYQNADGVVESKVIYEGGKWVVQQSQDDIKNLLENEVPNLVKELEKVETNVTEFDQKMNDARESILALDTNIGTINTEIGSVKDTVIALDTNIGAIQTDVGALNTNIGTINTEIGSVKNTVIELDTNIGTIGDTTNALQQKMTNAEGAISTLTQTAEGIQTRVEQVEKMELGGRNLLRGTDLADKSLEKWSNATVLLFKDGKPNSVVVTKNANQSGAYGIISRRETTVYEGETYTFSVDIRTEDVKTIDYLYIMDVDEGNLGIHLLFGFIDIVPDGKWRRYSKTFVASANRTNCGCMVATHNGTSFELKGMKLEKGNKATDWTPAPEDTDAKFSEITQTVDGIATRVGTAEGNISTLTQTASGLATTVSTLSGNVSTLTQTANGLAARVSTAEGNITAVTTTANGLAATVSTLSGNVSTLTQTASGLETAVETLEGNLSTVTQTANGLTTTVETLEGNLSTVTQTANGLQTKVSSVETNLNNLQIGGRNLWLNSKKFLPGRKENGIVTAITDEGYLKIIVAAESGNWLSWFSSGFSAISQALTENEQFTLSVEIMKEEGSVGNPQFYLSESMSYLNMNGEIGVGKFTTISHTRSFKSASALLPHLGLSDCIGTFYIKSIKLERGNKATDWTPAPEDADAKFSEITQTVDGIATRVGTAEGNISTLTQTASGLATRVGTAEGNISAVTQTANGLVTAVETLDGNLSTVTQTANGLVTSVETIEGNLTTVTQTAEGLQATVKGFSAEKTIESVISQMDKAINLRVVQSGIIDAINKVNQIDINNRGILIDAAKININGNTTFTNLKDKIDDWSSSVNATKIDGGKIYTGSITADKIKVTTLAALNSDLGAITAGSLNIGNKFIVDSYGNMTATSATITGKITATSGTFTGTVNASSGTITGSMVVSGTLSGGTISGATITTTKNATIGQRLYLSTGADMGIQFGNSSTEWHNSYIRVVNQDLMIRSSGNLSVAAEKGISIYNMTGGVYGGGDLQIYDFSAYKIWGLGGTIAWANNGALDEKTYGEHKVTAMSQNDIKFVTSNNTVTIGGKTAGVHFKNWNDTSYVAANASAFTVNSRRADKKNIVPFACPLGKTALDKVMQTPIYNYHYQNELDTELQHTGVILEEAPVEIADPSGIGVDVYAMVSVLWKAVQEQQAIIEELRSKIN